MTFARGNIFTPRAFWLAQTAGWLAYGVITFLAAIPLAREMRGVTLLGYKLGWAAAGLGASVVLGTVYQHSLPEQATVRRLVGTALGATAAVTPIWFFLHRTVSVVVLRAGTPFAEWTYLPRILADHFVVLLVWSGTYLSCRLWVEGRRQETRLLEARALAHEAQLRMLRYQLNPHFLFNSLTSIRALVLSDAVAAHGMVTELARFLRATLRGSSHSLRPLSTEIDVVRAYLAIEKVRFRSALEVAIDVAASAQPCLIPEFLIHPLVENAVRHGGASAAKPLHIRIAAHVDGGILTIEVANTVSFRDPSIGHDEVGLERSISEGSSGIGLRNVRQRLAAVYPGAYDFAFVQDGDWVRALISVPVSLAERRA